ncbi:cold-shock protein [Vibrio barjaei]|uniref:cold-shock protein n=1 Tax=Vibrio barjaei TaxID=1676683 RepID=UPI002284EE6C|nr:cold shock domain-containing protein [Vibrio barjaei]MCY9873008.1 cold shock domain-containing protein [Vibrio barjaei]
MRGTIASFLPTKGYGFIKGEDGNSYFVHVGDFNGNWGKSDLPGRVVRFEETVNDRGYAAKKVDILSDSVDVGYVGPQEFKISKSDSVKGYKQLQRPGWRVVARSSDSIDEARSYAISIAKNMGANAMVNWKYWRKTGWNGNYAFSVHHFSGEVVWVGNESLTEGVSKANLPDLDKLSSKRVEKMNRNDRRTHQVKWGLAFAAWGLFEFFDPTRSDHFIQGVIVFLVTLFLVYRFSPASDMLIEKV